MKKQWVVFLGLLLLVSSTVFAQTKTVTNADLEKFRQKRLQAEKEYRENYRRLGLPSPEELERQREEDKARDEQIYQQSRAERIQRRNDFQSRADDLKMRIASVEAQISYMRGQTGKTTSQTVIYGGYPGYYPYRRGGVFGGIQATVTPNVQSVRNIGNAYPNARDIGSVSNGGLIFSGPNVYGGYPGYYGGNPYYRGGYVPPLIISTNTAPDEASSQLLYLEQQLAGLLAEWELLEEQARQAGVRIN